MIEKIKSVLLILLVAMSIFLSWQIWSYQPDYDYLLPTEYVTPQGLAEKMELVDLIRPESIIFHFGSQQHKVVYPEMFQFTFIHDQINNWYFYRFREIEEDQFERWHQTSLRYEGVELAFSTSIPFQILQELFQLRNEEGIHAAIDRVLIYQNPITNEVLALFFAYEEQRVFRAATSISQSDLQHYLTLGENRPYYQAHQPIYSTHIHPNIYLPLDAVDVTEYRYFYQNHSIEPFISYLFVDPTLVRHIQDQNREHFYTDGSRGLHVKDHQLMLSFVHPVSELTQRQGTNNFVQRSVQFINQHRGWDDTYFLYDMNWDETNSTAEVGFRKYMGNYPVQSIQTDQDRNVIQVNIQQDRVVGYHRPLYKLDRVMNQVMRQLPSGESVIAHLEETGYSVHMISTMKIVYISEFQDHYISYKPHWYIQFRNGQELYFQSLLDVKEEANELE